MHLQIIQHTFADDGETRSALGGCMLYTPVCTGTATEDRLAADVSVKVAFDIEANASETAASATADNSTAWIAEPSRVISWFTL